MGSIGLRFKGVLKDIFYKKKHNIQLKLLNDKK